MNKQMELLLKLKKLADQGFGGEKANAELLLKKLMKKHGFKEGDLEGESIQKFTLPYKSVFERRLAGQIAYSVIGNINDEKGCYILRGGRKILIKCTLVEFLELEQKYEFYKNHFKKDLEIFYNAFVQSQQIFPPDHLKKEEKGKLSFFLSDEDRKILNLSESLEKHNFHKQLSNKNEKKL